MSTPTPNWRSAGPESRPPLLHVLLDNAAGRVPVRAFRDWYFQTVVRARSRRSDAKLLHQSAAAFWRHNPED